MAIKIISEQMTVPIVTCKIRKHQQTLNIPTVKLPADMTAKRPSQQLI